MSTAFPNRPNHHVGGRGRLRIRPRGGAVCVWPYYVGATHVTSAAAAQVEQSPTSPPTSLADMGGQYRAPIGTSTRDQTDRERDLEALRDFEAALEVAKFGCLSGREW